MKYVHAILFFAGIALANSTALYAKDLGGIQVSAFCQKHYPGSRAIIVDDAGKETRQNRAPGRGYGWRCKQADGSLHAVQMDVACHEQRGQNSTPQGDPNDAYTWKCVQEGTLPELVIAELSGNTVDHVSYGKTRSKLNIYRGNRMVILSPFLFPEADVPTIIRNADTCAAVYGEFSGRPWPFNAPREFPGLGSIALVEKTCGAGCGAGGKAEVTVSEFREAYKLIGDLKDPFTWQVAFYEFGRAGSSQASPSYPFSPELDPSRGHDVIASAYPEFAMSVCYDRLGYNAEHYQQVVRTKRYPRNQSVGEHARQFWESGLSFRVALSKDRKGYYRGWILSGLLYDLYRQFGAETTKRFLHELASIAKADGQAKDIAHVERNIIAAGNAAGGEALTNYLRQKWRMES